MENHKIQSTFTCGLTGDECLIILDFETNQEVCVLSSEYYSEEEETEIDPDWKENLPEFEKGYFLI